MSQVEEKNYDSQTDSCVKQSRHLKAFREEVGWVNEPTKCEFDAGVKHVNAPEII